MRELKIYCDLCGDETKGESIVGQFNYVEMSFIKKENQPKAKGMEFCSVCTDKIKEAIRKMKKSDEGVSENS